MTSAHFPRAHARATDPSTSHAAAATVGGISRSQAHILALFTHQGPMTDGDMLNLYGQMVDAGDYPPLSVSGIRTRRSELVLLRRLVDSGERALTIAGRKTIVWAAA